MIRAVCRCARGTQQPTAKKVQPAIRKRPTQDATDHDLNQAVVKKSPDNVPMTSNPAYGHNVTLETTNGPPSPTTYEMEAFHPVR